MCASLYKAGGFATTGSRVSRRFITKHTTSKRIFATCYNNVNIFARTSGHAEAGGCEHQGEQNCEARGEPGDAPQAAGALPARGRNLAGARARAHVEGLRALTCA